MHRHLKNFVQWTVAFIVLSYAAGGAWYVFTSIGEMFRKHPSENHI